MNRILLVLKEKGVKQIQLASSLGMAKSSVSMWCSNTVQPPLAKLHDIAETLGCDITDLLVSKKNKPL